MTAPLPAQETAAHWRHRHPRWFYSAVGTAAALVLIGLIAILLSVITGFMKSSDAYVGAVARAKSSPAIVSALGTPITEGWFVTGTIHVSGPTGLAELAIPLSGPKGHATLYVEASKRLGEWHFDHLMARVENTRARIDLAPVSPNPPPH